MATVTQRIPNLLGGVSQQIDNLKLATQVRDCVNAVPDPTFGLIKRSGGRFISELKNGSDVLYAPDFFDGGKWFSIFRDNNERYISCIRGDQIYVWNLDTGVPQTVSYVGAAQDYLENAVTDNYSILTLNDFTYITNRAKVVDDLAASGTWGNNKAFVSIKAIVYHSQYTVTLAGTSYSFSTPSNGVLTVSAVATGLQTPIAAAGYTVQIVGPGLYITRATPFTASAVGGNTGDALEVMQRSVPNVSKLPTQCVSGYVAKIVNTSGEEDDYYAEFIPDNGTSGPGIWQETVNPTVSPGLDPTTMPHELVSLGGGAFEFRAIDWEARLVGDDVSNSMPSFVGQTIERIFFYRNRFGALTNDNIVMSQSGDYFNFFVQSALTSSEADPIDVTVSTTKPAILESVVSVPQGLVIFSSNEQFLLTSAGSSLTPSNVNVRTLSRYEYDTNNEPADLGTTTAFLSVRPAYTRVFEMETLGNEESPYVNDITKVVPEWIPSNIDQVVGSSQNNLLSLGSKESRYLYMFSFFSDGQRRQSQAWFRWQMSGEVQYHTIQNDVCWLLTKQEDSLAIQQVNLTQSPSTSTIQTADGLRVDPRLDMWAPEPTAVLSGLDTKVYLPYLPDSGLKTCVLISNAGTSNVDFANAGQVFLPTTVAEDGGGWYVLIENRDIVGEPLIVGYLYAYDIEIPKIYYRSGENLAIADYTAYTTISRINFNMGLTGDVDIQVQAKGREDWTYLATAKKYNYYLANDIPFVAETIYTCPVHQRTENFLVRLHSETPFPVSLISMMWEGQYSPRFYTRR
jgi:hypothetical protein